MMLFAFLCWFFYDLASKPLISKKDSAILINFDKAESATQFVQILQDKHLIHFRKPLLLMIRIRGLAQGLKAGIYQIKPGETAMQLLSRVASGDVLTQNFTIISGTTQQKIAQDLAKASYLHYHPEDWLAVKGTYLNAEGLLLADTYQYQAGSESKNLMAHAHHNLVNYLTTVWTQRAPNLPYKTPYELLTAASIIEKETAVPQERQLISGVVVNRLNKKMPLQMDPTVIYALGTSYKGKLAHEDMHIDSPYNSYRYRGLPPTPIAMVSKDALNAAAHPQSSNYLYFVARGDGTHQFSETYEQQKQAIHQYQHKEH
jgi:UPF0755 protein